jgi:hypothetical protein
MDAPANEQVSAITYIEDIPRDLILPVEYGGSS